VSLELWSRGDPAPAVVIHFYGLAMTVLFFIYQARDVALSRRAFKRDVAGMVALARS